MIVLITWISGSWKTTLQNELIRRGWIRPNNITTREPRNDKELDEYLFVDRDRAFWLIKKWVLLEFTQMNWYVYWIIEPEDYKKNMTIIVDPVWRAAIMEKLNRKWIDYRTLYIDIWEEEQMKRLVDRYKWNEELISQRKLDLGWFHPTPNCTIVSWTTSVDTLADIVENL